MPRVEDTSPSGLFYVANEQLEERIAEYRSVMQDNDFWHEVSLLAQATDGTVKGRPLLDRLNQVHGHLLRPAINTVAVTALLQGYGLDVGEPTPEQAEADDEARIAWNAMVAEMALTKNDERLAAEAQPVAATGS